MYQYGAVFGKEKQIPACTDPVTGDGADGIVAVKAQAAGEGRPSVRPGHVPEQKTVLSGDEVALLSETGRKQRGPER